MRGSRLLVFGAGTVVGAALGWAAARREATRHRAALFDGRGRRRLAALATLESRAEPDTIHLLRDYLRWERQPMLRRRAQRALQRLEHALA